MFGEEEIVKAHKPRAAYIGNVIIACFAIILARLWYLQIYQGKMFLDYSLRNRLRKEVIAAPRGMIFSRNNVMLVDNIPRFDAVLTPQYVKDKASTVQRLAKILTMEPESIQKILTKNSTLPKYKSVVIKKNISHREVAIIETENSEIPGVSVETFISREYRDKEVGAHLLGYISEISPLQLPKLQKRDHLNYKLGDFIGQFGLEEELDLTLRGNDGYEFVEVDALGRKKRHIGDESLYHGVNNSPSVPGKNIRLTIDNELQVSAYAALEGKVGAAVMVDVNTGEILSMVSRPAFDPSQFSRGLSTEYWGTLVNDENHPMWDRNIQEHYSPGSTFKVITAVAALEEGLIDENTDISCDGSLTLGRKVYNCWRKEGHGRVTLVRALRESCNIYFQKVAKRMDIDVMAKYANMLGLGRRTNVALPREVTGLIPTKEWKKKKTGIEWQLGETLSCAIGQSYVLATPLQLAMAYSVIANGGKLYRPHVVKEIFTNSGQIISQANPEMSTEVTISPKTLKIVRQGLFEVVNHGAGTAYLRRGKGIQMAGKTGTSQVIRMSQEKLFSNCESFEYKYRNHGIFVSYAPSFDPKVAVAVVVEHGCHGNTSAEPVAVAMMQTYMKKYQPEIYKKILEDEKHLPGKSLATGPKPVEGQAEVTGD